MFRIGDFSKIAQVSGRLLRYYDEIGLLSPEFTDPHTGYRYYSAHQLPRLNRILVLKELGLSLEQVARLLERDASTDEIRGMLTLRKAQIERTVQEEMIRIRDIESRLKQLDVHGKIDTPDVVLKPVPEQAYLALREVLPGMDGIRRIVQKIASTVPLITGKQNIGNIAIVIHSPQFDPDALDVEVGYLVTGNVPESVKLAEDRVLTVRELPMIDTMATLVHVGTVDDRHQGYGQLANWLEAANYQIVGPGREILMKIPTLGEDDEAVIELQFPVTRLKSAAWSG